MCIRADDHGTYIYHALKSHLFSLLLSLDMFFPTYFLANCFFASLLSNLPFYPYTKFVFLVIVFFISKI